MNIAIVGSRTFVDYKFLKNRFLFVIKENSLNLKNVTIVSGGAKGADFLAEKLAYELQLKVKIFPADWKKYGKSAGILRNSFIVNESDLMVAFPRGKATGTINSIQQAKIKEIPVYIF